MVIFLNIRRLYIRIILKLFDFGIALRNNAIYILPLKNVLNSFL